ncbi:hypothetical protein J1N35_035057 [Gossypium stocksii]|uniref:Uncharacterized protein n=1 Tax=Gossypium stocksii TaxID=47602 RepID=A0A9D3ZR46_9ROSI|nr:hypothetical protein J1N35_035057 [Gossypium stocksii]
MVEFLIVDHSTAHNVIFDKSIIRMAKMIVATFCMTVKFLTLFKESGSQSEL